MAQHSCQNRSNTFHHRLSQTAVTVYRHSVSIPSILQLSQIKNRESISHLEANAFFTRKSQLSNPRFRSVSGLHAVVRAEMNLAMTHHDDRPCRRERGEKRERMGSVYERDGLVMQWWIHNSQNSSLSLRLRDRREREKIRGDKRGKDGRKEDRRGQHRERMIKKLREREREREDRNEGDKRAKQTDGRTARREEAREWKETNWKFCFGSFLIRL